jgi:hypothetical protein
VGKACELIALETFEIHSSSVCPPVAPLRRWRGLVIYPPTATRGYLLEVNKTELPQPCGDRGRAALGLALHPAEWRSVGERGCGVSGSRGLSGSSCRIFERPHGRKVWLPEDEGIKKSFANESPSGFAKN